MKYTEEERLAFARAHKWAKGEILIKSPELIHETAVIGGDGFGWVRDGDYRLLEMPHAGGLVIDKNVVIRAFVTVDRAVKGMTFIGEGSKLDHHCHVAHAARIGKYN